MQSVRDRDTKQLHLGWEHLKQEVLFQEDPGEWGVDEWEKIENQHTRGGVRADDKRWQRGRWDPL